MKEQHIQKTIEIVQDHSDGDHLFEIGMAIVVGIILMIIANVFRK